MKGAEANFYKRFAFVLFTYKGPVKESRLTIRLSTKKELKMLSFTRDYIDQSMEQSIRIILRDVSIYEINHEKCYYVNER